MGLTVIEKILIKHIEGKKLDDFIYANVDFCFGNDITAPLAVKEFEKAGFSTVFNTNKIGFICDHFLPAKDYKSANNVKLLREFSRRFNIKNFFDIDKCGVEHVFLIEKGLVRPGNLVIGADSHTCTYGALGTASFGVGSTDLAAAFFTGKCWFKKPEVIKFIYKGKLSKWVSGKDLILYTIGLIGVDGALYKVMEFCGPVIKKLDVESRLAMTNMAIEAGAKTGIIEFDVHTAEYLSVLWGKNRIKKSWFKDLVSDKDAKYIDIIEIDVSKIEPQVSCPHLPSNVKNVSELGNIKINQVFIGSCTNGRLSDLIIAARLIKGRKVKKGIRAIVSPATVRVYKQALSQGLIDIFVDAGFTVVSPTCGPCLGGHMGILDKGEVAIATTNRNFVGRMGHPDSFVYLSSPAVAAASAITGKITHPCILEKR